MSVLNLIVSGPEHTGKVEKIIIRTSVISCHMLVGMKSIICLIVEFLPR